MTDPHTRSLLERSARFIAATEALFSTLPEVKRTSHLATKARLLRKDIQALIGTPETKEPA